MLRALGAGALIALTATACGGARDEPATHAASAEFPPAITPYDPSIDPADFVASVDNRYFPLEPGTTYLYKGTTEGEVEKDLVSVLAETKEIMGVTCVVVEDVVSSKGEIAEKTFDWYAQDRAGKRLVLRRGLHRIRERPSREHEGVVGGRGRRRAARNHHARRTCAR